MFENFIGGRWLAPLHHRYLVASQYNGGVRARRVPRSSAVDVRLALNEARRAKNVWFHLGPWGRAVRLARISQSVDRRSPVDLADCGEQGVSALAGDQRTVDAVLELLTAPLYQFLHEEETEGGNRRTPAKTSAVIKLAFAADIEVEKMCWRVLPLLLEGHVLVVVLLYQDESHLSVQLPALMGVMASSLPPGALNLVTGLGLEAGIALMNSTEAVSPSALNPPHFYTSYPSPVCWDSTISR